MLKTLKAIYFYVRGRMCYEKEKYDKSIANYGKAILLDPNNAESFSLRGIMYFRKKDYDNAIADFESALTLVEPGDKDYKDQIQSFLKKAKEQS